MNISFFVVFHIIGLSAMAGTTLVDFLGYNWFWKQYAIDKQKAAVTLTLFERSKFTYAISFLVLLASGIAMVVLSHGLFAEQFWFRVKMILVLLGLINGAVIGGRVGGKIRARVAEEIAGQNRQGEINKLKGRLQGILTLQLIFFIIIFTLSAYKFN